MLPKASYFYFFWDTLEWKWINLGNTDRTVTKFLFPHKTFGIYAKLFTLKLSFACLFISLTDLLKFRLESSAKRCTLEYLIARIETTNIYKRNKWQPETKPLRTPYMLVRLELKSLLSYIISYHWCKKQSNDHKIP